MHWRGGKSMFLLNQNSLVFMMQEFKTQLLDFQNAIELVNQKNISEIKKASEISALAKKEIEKLKQHVYRHEFKSEEEEIQFFKYIKPQFAAPILYSTFIIRIETKRPAGALKGIKSFYQNELDRCNNLNSYEMAFSQYMRSNGTENDQQYFLRSSTFALNIHDVYYYDRDPLFSTPYDHKATSLIAKEKLVLFLEKQIRHIKTKAKRVGNKITLPKKLRWTANTTDLIELIYALESYGAINNGGLSIREMTTICELLFSIQIKDPFHTFSEIKRRNNTTKFLDNLKVALVNRIQEKS